MKVLILLLITTIIFCSNAFSNERARDLGIKIGRFDTGKYNAITDVVGVKVGHVTLKSGKGKLQVGKGPVRTGVTVVMPVADDIWNKKLYAGSFVLNGNGEATGLMWVVESGILETPIALTNTLSVGDVQKGLVQWMLKQYPKVGITDDTLTPVVFECDDSTLSDIRGMHVKAEHVFNAIENAKGGAVEEGAVGAGTGMISYEFKGGIGTSSRVLPQGEGGYTIGVLVNANHGRRPDLRISKIPMDENFLNGLAPSAYQEGSIIIIIATDAPLDSRQLSRISKRAMLGLAKTGTFALHGSGDIALAFSTANRIPHYPDKPTYDAKILSDFWINSIFEATSDATEEAVLNALFAAETTVGRDGKTAYAIPHDKIKELIKRSGKKVVSDKL